jgi:hypothetical protein
VFASPETEIVKCLVVVPQLIMGVVLCSQGTESNAGHIVLCSQGTESNAGHIVLCSQGTESNAGHILQLLETCS